MPTTRYWLAGLNLGLRAVAQSSWLHAYAGRFFLLHGMLCLTGGGYIADIAPCCTVLAE